MPDPPQSPRFCSECGNSLPVGAKFCPQCGARMAAAGPSPQPAPPEVAAGPHVPPELKAKYEQAREDLKGDRREVVVLFADVSGFTALSERLDPEEVSHLMQGLLRELAEVVYRYEGYVDKYIGDAIMALFGAPIAHENDPERAILAALDMLDVIARRKTEASHPLSLRVGLNLGEVVAAHVGSEARHQYTVMGDTVNVASRLESAAALDSILISGSLYERIASRFEAEEVPPLTVKGKTEPLKAYRVIQFLPAALARSQESTPFVGRTEELAVLELFLRRIAEETGGTLLIEAEAGTGKSRLVREALSRTHTQLSVLKVDFSQIDLPGRLSIPTDLFRQLAGADAQGPEDVPRSVQRALDLLGEQAEHHRAGVEGLARRLVPTRRIESTTETDPGVARQNRWSALAALLGAKSRAGPVLVLFEDAHWADETDQEFLGFLLPHLAGRRMGAIVTVRSDAAPSWIPPDVQHIVLRNLDDVAARSILGGLFESLEPRVRKELIRRSQGNPFYLEQLARSLRGAVETAVASVPGTVQGLLQSRIDRLPAPVQLLLQMASVLGTPFPIALLARMYGLESQPLRFDEALNTLKREDFFESSEAAGVSRFRHALMQEVAYGSILVRVRKVLHESAARLGEEHYGDRLEAEAPFFAHHYWEAGLLSEASPHLWNAGRAAVRNYELHGAERFLERLSNAIEQHPEILEEPGQRSAFIATYGTVLEERGRFEEAEEWFKRLQEHGERNSSEQSVGTALFHRGAIAWYRGKFEEAEALFEEGLSRVTPANERMIADLHSGLGLVHHRRSDVKRALEEHGQALQLRQRIDDRHGVVKSLMNIGGALYDLQDNLGGALEHYERALDLARETGDREMQCHLLLNLGSLDLERGEYKPALDRFDHVQELADEVGLTSIHFLGLRNQAACQVRLGEIQQALHVLRTCIRDGEEVLDPINRVAGRILLYEAHLSALDEEQAMKWLQEARELASQLEVKQVDDWLLLSSGRWAAAHGDWEEAANDFALAAETALGLRQLSNASVARAHRCRAMARAGLESGEDFPVHIDARTSMTALFSYLRGDAAAAKGRLEEAVSALDEAGNLAARIGDSTLERAAFQREAEVLHELGNESGERQANLRAARAMLAFRRRLPQDLRDQFDNHPRNARLQSLVSV